MIGEYTTSLTSSMSTRMLITNAIGYTDTIYPTSNTISHIF